MDNVGDAFLLDQSLGLSLAMSYISLIPEIGKPTDCSLQLTVRLSLYSVVSHGCRCSSLMPLGPIVYYEQFGKSSILISSHKVAVDLFERRGQNYSDRSRNVAMGAEL